MIEPRQNNCAAANHIEQPEEGGFSHPKSNRVHVSWTIIVLYIGKQIFACFGLLG